jgi:hypothetical protein
MLAPFSSSRIDCCEATSPSLKIERSSQGVFNGSGVAAVGGGVAVDWVSEQETRSRLNVRTDAISFLKINHPFYQIDPKGFLNKSDAKISKISNSDYIYDFW